MGSTERRSAAAVSALLWSTGVDLLTSGVLLERDASELARSVLDLYAAHSATGLAWNLGGRGAGHLASLVGPALVPLYQLLLFTLPGTPALQYGDEIGLMDEVSAGAGARVAARWRQRYGLEGCGFAHL